MKNLPICITFFLVLYSITFLFSTCLGMNISLTYAPINYGGCTNVSPRKLIAIIDTEINNTFQHHSCFWDFIKKSHTKEDYHQILNTVNNYYSDFQPISIKDIKTLNNKNVFFAETMNYFSEVAYKNFNDVTSDTLDIIRDFQAKQPTAELNKLPKEVKIYVMGCAYNRIKLPRYTEFFGHSAPIDRVAINEPSLLASSASKDGTFLLWHLVTGKQLYKFPEKAISGYVKFNKNGTLLATATLFQEKPLKITITIWDIQSKKALWQIKRNQPFHRLAFFEYNNNIIFAVLDESTSSLYKLKKNTQPILLGMHKQSLATTIDKGIPIKRLSNNGWAVERNARFLYLCKRAVKNTTNIASLSKITENFLFAKMLTTEQDIVRNKITKKKERAGIIS